MDMLFLPPELAVGRLDPGSSIYWLPKEGISGRRTLSECVQGLTSQIAVVLPIEVCSFFAIQLPTRKARWIDQAMAYAVEELLAEGVDELHLARGEVLEDGRHRVGAVRKRLLSDWIDQLKALGFEVVAIHVDADLLPRDDTQLLFLGPRGLLGGALEARLAFDPAHWGELATQLPSPRYAHGSVPEAPPAVDSYQRLADPFHFLAEGRANALDLAQGEFAKKNTQGHSWHWALALAVMLTFISQITYDFAKLYSLRSYSQAYEEQNVAFYRNLFPQDVRIVNLRAQFDAHLAQADSENQDFVKLLDTMAGTIVGGDVVVNSVRYKQLDRVLEVSVDAPDFEELEQVRQRMAQVARFVRIKSASRARNSVAAEITFGG